MNIYVCVKQVPNTNEVKIDPVTNTLIRDNVESILNNDDANALEQALRLKDERDDVYITVVSMGPPQAAEALRECLAMGADEALLLSDRAFGGADTWATSNTLAAALRRLMEARPADIIFAGRQAIDGDTAQVGPQIAEKLGIPQVTYVQAFQLGDGTVEVQRQLEDGYERIEVDCPVLLTAIKELNTPRYMSVRGVYAACDTDIPVWGRQDIPVRDDEIGLKSSPTRVMKSFTPPPRSKGMMLEGNPRQQVTALVAQLAEKYIL